MSGMQTVYLRKDAVGLGEDTLKVETINWSTATSGYIKATSDGAEYAIPLYSILYVTD